MESPGTADADPGINPALGLTSTQRHGPTGSHPGGTAAATGGDNHASTAAAAALPNTTSCGNHEGLMQIKSTWAGKQATSTPTRAPPAQSTPNCAACHVSNKLTATQEAQPSKLYRRFSPCNLLLSLPGCRRETSGSSKPMTPGSSRQPCCCSCCSRPAGTSTGCDCATASWQRQPQKHGASTCCTNATSRCIASVNSSTRKQDRQGRAGQGCEQQVASSVVERSGAAKFCHARQHTGSRSCCRSHAAPLNSMLAELWRISVPLGRCIVARLAGAVAVEYCSQDAVVLHCTGCW